MMRFIRNTITAVLILLSLSCGHTNASSDLADRHSLFKKNVSKPIKFDLDKIKSRGTLRAIVFEGPTSYFLYKGQAMGFEYELLKHFATHLNVDLKIIVAKNFDELGELLNSGAGDLIAHGFTVTLDRQKSFMFSDYLYLTKQVLVQRKPKNWRAMKLHEIDKELKHDPIHLIGDTVTIRDHSSYKMRLENVMNEIGGLIHMNIVDSSISTDELIHMVHKGDIKYTIADNTIANVFSYHFKNLHVSTPISFSQRASWVLRRNTPELKSALDAWITQMKQRTDYYVIYNRYFKNRSSILRHVESDYYFNRTGEISPYDDLIKKYAENLPWDWLLLASQVYQESRFDPEAKSWARAHGLMQIMPSTAEELGITNTANPEESLRGGTSYLLDLWNEWQSIPDVKERIKFTLASYNAGLYHIKDAVRLTTQLGGNPKLWDDHVEQAVLKLTLKKYYTRPEIKYGYVQGTEPVNYVKDILKRHRLYQSFFEETI
ncbi:transporter substrate-binding domain-containing protein [Aestuariivivens sediminicola]|uniref:transporter substrate-binding domain-containing protein n=1 Tax=Aestuariivivens sediminicola TaxID=2913560 RepID=UPI001F591F5E|nr:transporter substrate-binding domain-containing protein [Aestuariivivens sediminicola]